ncbi:hypothetical protein K440DRAFT_624826 [Wilcoxina mikolae CBS 423.85]|nr:hypothetical protein K440DRAFT_624826 [Wilcoxina mikolae CBS 423.85]
MTAYYEYGWGLGTFLFMNCATSAVLTTYRNPSWMLYATETNPAKGPMPTITTSSTSTSSTATSQPQSSSTAVTPPTATPTGKGTGLPIGAIAGIAIGGIVAIGLCIAGIMLLRSRLKKNNDPPPHGGDAYQTGYQTKEPTSPTIVYDGPRSPTIVYDDSNSVKNAMYPVVPQSPTYPAPQSPTYPTPQGPAYSTPQSPSYPATQQPGSIGY